MNNKYKELIKRNEEMEKKIYSENNTVYTDMIVYMRSSDMTKYNQEVVREDLIQMIIDGQNRGDNISKVMGENYKEVCDEIIENMPKKTLLQKVLGAVELAACLIWIIGGIFIVESVLKGIIKGDEFWKFSLSAGDIINVIAIVFMANIVVKYICKTTFKQKKTNKWISFLKTWGVCFLFLSIVILSSCYLKSIIVQTSLLTAGIVVGMMFILDKALSMCING